jgi:hypothetical protein
MKMILVTVLTAGLVIGFPLAAEAKGPPIQPHHTICLLRH